MNTLPLRWAAWTLALGLTAAAQAAPPVNASQPVGGLLNDAGATLPEPDLRPYQAQIDAMKRLQRDALETDLRLQLAKQQLEMAKARAELTKIGGQSQSGTPYVMSLFGVAGARQARLMVPGFGVVTAGPGATLPNNWRIVEINEQTVLARQGKSGLMQLPFYTPE
ncbi:MAG: hypothetical protein JO171_04815 [Paludibacterium sp.]|uniref:hypothetical protein n=1 Tax=Paludibacterium sp. TaxID=1917523 RepID=UPI0025E29378|nr:hypothetical protein [Paludibacterium sp.]MBV8046447.1 hypothetical protein [Paludibacterium sp.]MBV8645839.1 hypothetical protein [Paludibacterium sp.]